jgi:hypothetical protein
MSKFKETSGVAINNFRHGPKRTTEVGNVTSILGLWILLPAALSGLTFVILSIFFGAFLSSLNVDIFQQIFILSWILISIFCQTIYWMWIAQSIGVGAFQGMWFLVPIIGWLKTFRFSYLLVQKTRDYSAGIGKQASWETGFKSDSHQDDGVMNQVSKDPHVDVNVDPVSKGHHVAMVKKLNTVALDIPKKVRKNNSRRIVARRFISATRFRLMQVFRSTRMMITALGGRKKWVAFTLIAVVLLVVGSFIGRPRYYDYKAKSSASDLILKIQDVMETSARRPLDFSIYSDKLNPSFDEFLSAGSDVWRTANTNCSSNIYDDIRYTFGELRQSDSNFNFYPETVIGLLNMYVKSCG